MIEKEYSSFRDPSGFVYREQGVIFRHVNKIYLDKFEHMHSSGLYEKLVAEDMIIKHVKVKEEVDYTIIKPEKVPFISYPYEWSFSQLKDAAITTLNLHKHAMSFGMLMKDASAFNIQFINNKPKLIDTLSFDFYNEGEPWVAYGQFCSHFLAPLFLMAEVDIRMSQMLRMNIDGIPIDLASKLLEKKSKFAIKQHIHWHAKSVTKHATDGKAAKGKPIKSIKISKFNHLATINSLIKIISKLELKHVSTEWMNYYQNTNYTDKAFGSKSYIVTKYMKKVNPEIIWDLGANDGTFSRLALKTGVKSVVAFDIDPLAVEKNYLMTKEHSESILPLLLDLTNPSPALGFNNAERLTIGDRSKPDCILALALIHHLCISKNIPFEMVAESFVSQSDKLIIEFIPKEDSQVEVLLKTRDDIFNQYNQVEFEKAFSRYYDIIELSKIDDSDRTLFLMKRRGNIET